MLRLGVAIIHNNNMFLLGLFRSIFFCMFGCFDCMFIYVPHACLVPGEIGIRRSVLWNCSYRWLWAALWVLGTELESFIRAASITSNPWIISSPRPLSWACLPLLSRMMLVNMASWICTTKPLGPCMADCTLQMLVVESSCTLCACVILRLTYYSLLTATMSKAAPFGIVVS